MFCSNCGKTLKGDAATCPHCKAAVGDSRFDGHTYTGAQIRTRPGEAVRLPGNHTKTTFMGTDPSMDVDVDARTTYRATAGAKVPEYSVKHEEREPLYDSLKSEEEPEMLMFGEGDTAQDEPAQENPIPEEAQEAEEEERPKSRRRRREEVYEEYIEDDGEEEPEEEIKPRKKKRAGKKKKSASENEKSQEEIEEEAELNELRARDIQLDDRTGISEDVRNYMNQLHEEALQKQQKAEQKAAQKAQRLTKQQKTYESEYADAAQKPEKAEKKSFSLSSLRAKMRRQEEDFDSIIPDDAEEVTDQDEFDLGDLPPAEAEYGTEEEYGAVDEPQEDNAQYDEEYSEEEYAEDGYAEEEYSEDAEYASNDFDPNELDYGFEDEVDYERRKKIKTIVKYSLAALVVIAVLVSVIVGLSFITEKTKTAPIDGVTLELYDEGIALMKQRVSTEYQSEKLSKYDGTVSSMVQVTDNMSKELDNLALLLPEAPSMNDNRFIAALTAIQSNINNCLTNDMLALTDTTKSTEARESESAERWTTVREMVSVLVSATNPAQLDAIVNGEKIDVIQQTTPEPVVATTPAAYTTLAVGSDGQAVVELQSRLSELGYLTSEVDGDFGNKTKTAVQLFQKAVGLETNGIADAETQIALFADNAPHK